MIAAGLRRTRSAASARSRSEGPSAVRYSIVTSRPSDKPNSAKPRRNPSIFSRGGSPGRTSSQAMVGFVRCCALTRSGHPAALPSPAMNSRRCIDDDPRAHWNEPNAIKVARKLGCTAGPAAMSLPAQVFGRRQDVLSTRSWGRRPKSAKARNRGGWGTRRGSERYGDLGGSCVPVRFDGSGPDDRFRSRNCGIDFERALCALRERIWGGAAGRCGATMHAGALPGESEPEWRWSMRWRIDGAGIMRCRS